MSEPAVIARSEHSISRRDIDPDAIKVLYRLYRAGHTAYLVGGGVRDLLLGRRPKDFDIVTSARPAQVKRLFRNCRLIGRRFRLAHLHYASGKIIELSTFRAQPDLELGDEDDLLVVDDNRFGTPHQDAVRRDFTINSLFYDIATFSLIDYVGGMQDVRNRVIRTIGDPMMRFQEDPVRMVRAIKFSARLGFTIEPATWEAITRLAGSIHRSAPARLSEEVARLLEQGSASRSLELLDESGLLEAIDLNLEAYLRTAERVAQKHDPDGRLLHRLLARCDRAEPRERPNRVCLYCLWVLPLALSEGLLEPDDEGDGWWDAVMECAGRLGVARREQEFMHTIFLLFRRLALKRKRRKGQGRPLEEREGFAEALRMLEFLSLEASGFEEEVLFWKERAKAARPPARKPAFVPRRAPVAEVATPEQGRRRLRRRRPTEEMIDG